MWRRTDQGGSIDCNSRNNDFGPDGRATARMLLPTVTLNGRLIRTQVASSKPGTPGDDSAPKPAKPIVATEKALSAYRGTGAPDVKQVLAEAVLRNNLSNTERTGTIEPSQTTCRGNDSSLAVQSGWFWSRTVTSISTAAPGCCLPEYAKALPHDRRRRFAHRV